jgi:hypothetical protein
MLKNPVFPDRITYTVTDCRVLPVHPYVGEVRNIEGFFCKGHKGRTDIRSDYQSFGAAPSGKDMDIIKRAAPDLKDDISG